MADIPESTGELLDRARAGDGMALERLCARHLHPLRRWATGRLPRWARSTADTDDLVQDVVIQTLKKIDVFVNRRPGALQAYLRQGVINRIRDEVRRSAREPAVAMLDGQDVGGSPLDAAIGREAVDRYERALARLRPAEREAIIGRLEMGYTYEELAEVMGKPSADAARKAAERALLRLAEAMGHAR